MANDFEVLIDNLVKGHLEKKRRKKYGEEGIILEWYFRECFPKTPPTIRKMELNESGDTLTYHMNIPIPLTFDSIKKLERELSFTVKYDCEVLMANNYEVFIRFYKNKIPNYCRFDYKYFDEIKKGELLLGMDRNGLFTIPLDKSIHWLIAGTTGSGKSTLVRLILASILMNNDNVQLYIIDQKRVEFVAIAQDFNIPVAYDQKTINKLIIDLQKESDRRTQILVDNKVNDVKKLKGYNLPDIVVVFDEVAEMAGKEDLEKENQQYLDSLSRLSRSNGFHILCATQKPHTKLWDKFSSTREMLSTRICLRVNDESTSRMVLDSDVASKIGNEQVGRGFMLDGYGKLKEIQFFDISFEQLDECFERKYGKIEKNPPVDYIDVEGTVVDAENENCISIGGVSQSLINKVNKQKDMANIKYRKEDGNGQRKTESASLRNDRRRKENSVSERKAVQPQKQQKVRKDDGCKDTGSDSTIQITNGKTGVQNFIL